MTHQSTPRILGILTKDLHDEGFREKITPKKYQHYRWSRLYAEQCDRCRKWFSNLPSDGTCKVCLGVISADSIPLAHQSPPDRL